MLWAGLMITSKRFVQKTREITRHFKNTFSWRDLRVHFVGVWDTISSVGLIKGDVFLSTSSSAAHACHFRHALALDERRVKLMPEYFQEMNSLASNGKYKYFVSPNTGHTSPTGEPHQGTTGDNLTESSAGRKNKPPDIKEVWFAGCHSDIGGTSKPGKSHLSGNVLLLWMRREATESGLKLQPTDLVWVPADLDFGTSNSMCKLWPVVEYMPITHQVSFSGPGGSARCLHRSQPRRIIPGQKLHASILYANAYKPEATLGEGFDIPMIQAENTEPNNLIWEIGLFDKTAAEELVKRLGSKEGVASIYLDRLLFMLRFKEGRDCLRQVPRWQEQFTKLIDNREHTPFVKLAAIVAYYEASCDPDVTPNRAASTHIELLQAAPSGSHTPTHTQLNKDILEDVQKSLYDILVVPNHRDGPRIVALLRPLTRHQVLRKRILIKDVLEKLVLLLDAILSQRGGNLGQAMDGLICLLQYEDTWKTTIQMLNANYQNLRGLRLSRILEMKNYHHLTAALRMVLALARIPAEEAPQARRMCSAIKPRLNQLSKKDEGLVGVLAVEILLTLDRSEKQNLNISNKNIRANLASALVLLHPERGNSGNNHCVNSLVLVNAEKLNDGHKMLIGELKGAAQKWNTRERTASTMTLLKLCESEIIRNHLAEIRLLDLFINQLQCKDRALLAAYALATCLKYNMTPSNEENTKLSKNIVRMLRLGYFDDAVGSMEGFEIFHALMQHEALNKKLGKKEIRTSLICLDVFQSLDKDGPWTRELVERSVQNLKDPVWKVQKAGVTVLSALAQTEHGEAVISPQIVEIVEMLLSQDHLSKSPSWMMGPACALCILAQNGKYPIRPGKM
ncbi:hypothetical protein JVU11DRAFT_10727 [Chiua virens]|nr:hypothetical protein JVU11DRAFT_10727 [Chiua virens]